LLSPDYWQQVNDASVGVALQNINATKLKAMSVALPPLAEQQCIVDILEEQFSRLDAALASVQAAREKGTAFRRSLLQAAFDGELSAGGTAGWEVKQLKDVAQIQLGRQRSPQHHTGENMRPYLRAANVTWNGLDLSDIKEMNFTDAEMNVYRLRPKDIVINEASGSASALGKPAMFLGEIEDCGFQNHLIRIRATVASAEYLYWYLLHNALSGAYHSESSGIGILNLGKTRVASWLTPIPPPAVQQQLVQALEEQFSRLDEAVKIAKEVESRIAAERRSLLHSAFSGELTAKWRETQGV
jgi:type I restriction enzyme S subunit